MSKVNTVSSRSTLRSKITTHEGGTAKRIDAEQQLRRSVMACMLWEDSFYEDGQSIADRIASYVPLVDPKVLQAIAIEAREKMKLRHMPLLLVREMARLEKCKPLVAETLSRIIQRADELSEFVAIYWKDKRQPLSAQVKKGLALAFQKFNAYQLAKYNREAAIKLRDVLFLCHAKPKDDEQAALWKSLVDGTLEPPDTWEVALSSGKDKKETWERLLQENKLGALALLRNLRNMQEAKVSGSLILTALDNINVDRVLPFRFISAARFAPQWESNLESAMLKCLAGQSKLGGKTVLLIDVSDSMDNNISAKSDLKRIDAANGLAILARELCERVAVYTFSEKLVRVADRHGFALRDAIIASQVHSGTYLGQAVETLNKNENYDRLVVLTDEQSHDDVPNAKGKGYVINVAAYQNGIGYGQWTHIDGWSEAVFDYIALSEQ